MALPVLSVNPVVGNMALESGTRIGSNLARLGAEIGANLEKKAIYEEAQQAAPELNAAYRNAFSLFQSGDTATGFQQLFDVSTKYAGNPILSKMNEMAFRAGNELSTAYLQKEMAGLRFNGTRSPAMTSEEVDAQFTAPDGQEVDVSAEMPVQDEVDMTAEPTGGLIPESGPVIQTQPRGPQVQTQPPSKVSSQQQIAAMPPQQRMEASQGVIANDNDMEENFETFTVPEKLRPYFMGASAIGLPKESSTSISGTKNVSSKGTYSRSETETKTSPRVPEETKKNFDAITKAASTLDASAAVQKAIEKAGGFDNLQIAPPKPGLKETYALTWPGNTGETDKDGKTKSGDIQISKEDYNAFLAIKSLPVTAAQSGAKFFGTKSSPSSNGKARVPNEIVKALKANPRDPQAIKYLEENYGENASYLQRQIVSQ